MSAALNVLVRVAAVRYVPVNRAAPMVSWFRLWKIGFGRKGGIGRNCQVGVFEVFCCLGVFGFVFMVLTVIKCPCREGFLVSCLRVLRGAYFLVFFLLNVVLVDVERVLFASCAHYSFH
jgi:hypothetical protein